MAASRFLFVRQAAEWMQLRRLRRPSGLIDTHRDIFSAVSHVHRSDCGVHISNIPCLRVTLTAVGMMTLALDNRLQFQCSPCRWRLKVDLYARGFGTDGSLFYAVAPQFVYLDA